MSELKHPIKISLQCGAVGYITRYDPDCLYPYVATFSEDACTNYLVFQLQTHDLEGRHNNSVGKSYLDIRHYFVGRMKLPIAELQNELGGA